jgi:hypothetical protein
MLKRLAEAVQFGTSAGVEPAKENIDAKATIWSCTGRHCLHYGAGPQLADLATN